MHTRRLTAPRRLRRAVLAATTGVALVAASAGMAVADTVYNTVDSSVDNASETLTVTAGSTNTTTIKLTRKEMESDGTGLQQGNSNCLVSPSDPLLLDLVSSDPSKATVQATSPQDPSKPAQLRFTGCSELVGQSITVTGVAQGSATISVTKSAGTNNSGTFHLAPATFTANVVAAQQTNPCAGATAPAAPTVAFSPAGPDGSNGWYKTVPTVSASSTTSGVTIEYSTDGANYSITAPTLGEGETTVTAKATNSCNLSSTGSATAKVDTIAPAIPQGSLTDSTWRNSNLSRAFAASDTGSGLADAADASFTLTASANSTLDTNDNPVPTVHSRTVTDVAGNSTTRSVSALIDKVAPVITPGDDSSSVWSARGASADFTASDALSGLADAADGSFTLTVSAESASASAPTTHSKTVTDRAGNEATRTLSRLIDTSGPLVSPESVDASGTWRSTSLSQEFEASDNRSGLATGSPATFTLEASAESTKDADGNVIPTVVERTVSDAVGNSTTRFVKAKIDKTNPTAGQVADIDDRVYYPHDTLPTGSCTAASDALSGLASSSTTPTRTGPVNGVYTYTCSAADNAGNTASNAVTVRTASYGFTSLLQPVDQSGVFNRAKAGSAIPVKFRLSSGVTSLAILDGNPTAKTTQCPGSSATVTAIDEFSNSNTSGLQYSDGQHSYVWKTPTTYAGKCYELTVNLMGGEKQTALFQFTK